MFSNINNEQSPIMEGRQIKLKIQQADGEVRNALTKENKSVNKSIPFLLFT